MSRVFAKAVDLVGGQTEMARLLSLCTGRKILQGHVWAILYRNKKPFPAELCRAVEIVTDHKITRDRLRPDLFPPAKRKERRARTPMQRARRSGPVQRRKGAPSNA